MPPIVLRRRFQKELVLHLLQELGHEEFLIPLKGPVSNSERADCLEPISTGESLEIAVSKYNKANDMNHDKFLDK